MSMKMGWRWYGEGNDPITLADIKQIPGVDQHRLGPAPASMPGEVWEERRDQAQVVRSSCSPTASTLDVVESVNVHDDIKVGLPTRDQYIENYKPDASATCPSSA